MKGTRAKGVVAAGHRLTAEAAAGVLREGGHAADAAIAALAMACVCEPVLASPGGGGFAMLRDGATGRATLVDFFPHTPRKRKLADDAGVAEVIADFGTATQAFHIGPATAAAPGFLAGCERLAALGGGRPLADLFAPAVRAARDGVRVTPYQHYLSTVVLPILTATPEAAALFAPGGEMIGAGGTFRNPGLANALEAMASGGLATSAVGNEVVGLQAGRGHLTADDLSSYEAIERRPLSVGIGAMTAHLNPLPAASGVLIADSLNGIGDVGGVTLARALDATDRARRQAGHDLSRLIDRPLRQRGTTHVSVIDAAGNACAVTVSNGEGNGEPVGRFGFMLNNILGEEDVNPAGASAWPENVRLASMMCPAILEAPDGAIVALGSGGSNRIRSAIAQVIAHLALDGANLADAVVAPRLHVENGHLDFEDFFDAGARAALAAAFGDHRAWPERNMFFGGVHAASVDADGRFSGIGDARRDGAALLV
ncbi:MAG: gamma-glutamyltransferase [Rhizobiaceae bacterium]